MEAVKEKLIGAINLMSLEDATSLWEYVINSHTFRTSLTCVSCKMKNRPVLPAPNGFA